MHAARVLFNSATGHIGISVNALTADAVAGANAVFLSQANSTALPTQLTVLYNITLALLL
jgi:hypothetical protein